MAKWELCKITIEARQGDRVQILELGPKALTRYVGLGWGTLPNGDHLFEQLSSGHRPTGIRPTQLFKSGLPNADEPALLLKEPECGVEPWP